MICGSVKQGYECHFMTKRGCQYNGGTCHSIIEQCKGCQRAKSFSAGEYCINFPDPASKWRVGRCNMATHVKAEGAPKPVVKVNPLKASKRASR